jgi:hypothetical protein
VRALRALKRQILDIGCGILDTGCSIVERYFAFIEYPVSRDAPIEYRVVTIAAIASG